MAGTHNGLRFLSFTNPFCKVHKSNRYEPTTIYPPHLNARYRACAEYELARG